MDAKLECDELQRAWKLASFLYSTQMPLDFAIHPILPGTELQLYQVGTLFFLRLTPIGQGVLVTYTYNTNTHRHPINIE